MRIEELEKKNKLIECLYSENTKDKCEKCGKVLELGKFAYNQKVCWNCFKEEVYAIRYQVCSYPSWLWHKREEHCNIIEYLLAVLAQNMGEEV